MTYTPSFVSARAKYARAELHRNALDHNITQTFEIEANRIPLRAEYEPKSGYHIFRISKVPNLEEIRLLIGLGIGDIVHNLRGALDHAFWQLALVRWNGAPPKPRRIQFPMDDDPKVFASRDVRGDLLSDHWDLVESHQPYRGLDGRPDSWSASYVHQLALLRDLTDHDKHRITTATFLLPNSVHLPAIPGVWLDPVIRQIGNTPIALPFEFIGAGKEVALEVEVCRAVLRGPGTQPQIDNAGQVTPHITLAEGRPVIATIDRLTSRVDLILSEIEGRFP